MSSQLRMRFGAAMPAAIVEVIAPNLETVARVLLTAEVSRIVDVPSESCLLRVHLPSGEIVTLEDSGSLDREVTLDTIDARARRQTQDATASDHAESLEAGLLFEGQAAAETTSLGPEPRTHSDSESLPLLPQTDAPLGVHGVARLFDSDGLPIAKARAGREARWDLDGPLHQGPLALRIEQPAGQRLELRLPGDARRVRVRADAFGPGAALTLRVRLSTAAPAADALVSYLHRGDLHSAAAMTAWLNGSEVLRRETMEDPYAACVGAYLLLRLRAFGELRHWSRDLVDRFPTIPDVAVILAAQQQHGSPRDTGGIRELLVQAAQRDLPVYTEGLRLLLDGLHLLGDEGQDLRRRLRARTGAVIWPSPLTASIHARASDSVAASQPVHHDIAFC